MDFLKILCVQNCSVLVGPCIRLLTVVVPWSLIRYGTQGSYTESGCIAGAGTIKSMVSVLNNGTFLVPTLKFTFLLEQSSKLI
jgi:hypothetical protein